MNEGTTPRSRTAEQTAPREFLQMGPCKVYLGQSGNLGSYCALPRGHGGEHASRRGQDVRFDEGSVLSSLTGENGERQMTEEAAMAEWLVDVREGLPVRYVVTAENQAEAEFKARNGQYVERLLSGVDPEVDAIEAAVRFSPPQGFGEEAIEFLRERQRRYEWARKEGDYA